MKIALSPVTAVCCDAPFQTIDRAAIHIENQRISYVGPADIAPAFEADETVGGPHLVAMPGLINTHTHAAMTLCRGYADDMALEPWLGDKIWPFERNLEAEHIYWGTLLAIAEMIRGGTTTFCDMYFFERHGVRAALETGMRMAPGAVLLGFLPGSDEKIAAASHFIREFSGAGEGRISPYFAPHSLYTCDALQWQKIIAAARDLGVLISTHASETRREVADVTAQWGASPIQTLEKIGALEGPLLAAHCVYTDETDREIMANRPFRVAHNPQSNLKLASGIAPVADYLRRGITVGLGPDGPASNNNLDMWEEMRLAATLHKAATGDPTAVSARAALEMATIGGAKCLGLENEIGSLEVGKKADILLVDFDKPHLYPRHNVVSHLVYAAGASDVHSTMVDGQWLLRRGEFTHLDVREISAHIVKIAEDLARRA
ncbi:MAG TPA: amidohydrolase [Abditibacterium sp.]|jgi:5-methylthioadenosine/S-adenosylhomocysteine deaminase